MEQLIQHYLKRLIESTLTPEQRKLYQGLLDEYSALYLQEIYSQEDKKLIKEVIQKSGKTTIKYEVRINKNELNKVIEDMLSTTKLNKKTTIEVKQ